MHSEPSRRRRLNENSSGGKGGIPIVPLVIVVILGGLLLGSVLARFLGRGEKIVAPTPAPLVQMSPLQPERATPPLVKASPRVSASPATSPSPTPSTSPSAGVSSTPSSSPSFQPSPRVSPKSSALPNASPKPLPSVSAKPLPPVAKLSPRPAVTPKTGASVRPSERAESIVRRYLDALERGNIGEARSYLASGDPSESSFMNGGSQLSSLRVAPSGGTTYAVNADVMSDGSEYFITFTVDVELDGAVITEHTAIKP